MKYMEFTNKPVRPIVKNINVKSLGLPRVVIVKTKKNGGVA